MSDEAINLGSINRSDLIFLLKKWLEMYFHSTEFQEYWSLQMKILKVLSMKLEGKEILPRHVIVDLDKSFNDYTSARLEIDEKVDEFNEYEDLEEQISPLKRQLIGKFEMALSSLKPYLI